MTPKLTPRNYQVADVDVIVSHGGSGCVVADPGAGKSVIAVESIRQLEPRTTLVLAPQGTHRGPWRGTITGKVDQNPKSEHYGQWVEGLIPDARVHRIDSTSAGKAAMDGLEWGEPGIYLMTPQLFTRWTPFHLRPDMMIVDEIHLLGNPGTKKDENKSIKMTGGLALRKSAGMAGAKLGLSGTFVRNHFEYLWTAMRWIYGGDKAHTEHGGIADLSYHRWVDDNCATEYDHFAPTKKRIIGELYPGQFVRRVPVWRQHFKRETCCEFHEGGFLAHLPEPSYILETVDLTPQQRKMIRRMEDEYLAYLEVAATEFQRTPAQERRALVVKTPITRDVRVRQMRLAEPSILPRPWKPAPEGKEEHGWELAEDGVTKQQLDQHGLPQWDVVFDPDAASPIFDKALAKVRVHTGEAVVMTTSSQKFAELAVSRFANHGIRAFEWSSKHNQDQRDDALDDLRAQKLDVIVGVTEAIGTGVDGLQDAAGVLIRAELSLDLSAETQLISRLDRLGQIRDDGVIVYDIVAELTEDIKRIRDQQRRRMELNKSLRRTAA